jgi:hypothetical protein
MPKDSVWTDASRAAVLAYRKADYARSDRRYTDEMALAVLALKEAGWGVARTCRTLGFADTVFYHLLRRAETLRTKE